MVRYLCVLGVGGANTLCKPPPHNQVFAFQPIISKGPLLVFAPLKIRDIVDSIRQNLDLHPPPPPVVSSFSRGNTAHKINK